MRKDQNRAPGRRKKLVISLEQGVLLDTPDGRRVSLELIYRLKKKNIYLLCLKPDKCAAPRAGAGAVVFETGLIYRWQWWKQETVSTHTHTHTAKLKAIVPANGCQWSVKITSEHGRLDWFSFWCLLSHSLHVQSIVVVVVIRRW